MTLVDCSKADLGFCVIKTKYIWRQRKKHYQIIYFFNLKFVLVCCALKIKKRIINVHKLIQVSLVEYDIISKIKELSLGELMELATIREI